MENGEKKTVSRKVIDREVIMRKYHVHIKNFRNLKDVKVTLSPLTILTGENGSGKSTLFKALLFLKHNHDHEAAKKLKYVIDDDINLGGWEHIANDPKKPISIKITEETWGYDHEVEEIYDIDNCPFELNPTEEYAEKLNADIWRKPETKIPHMFRSFFDLVKPNKNAMKFYPVKENKTKIDILTSKSESHGFQYLGGVLENIEIGLDSEKINFTLKYFHKGYDAESTYYIQGSDFIDRSEFYFVIVGANSEKGDSSELLDFFSRLSMINYGQNEDEEIMGQIPFRFSKPFFESGILDADHEFSYAGPLVAWRLAEKNVTLFKKYNYFLAQIFNNKFTNIFFDSPFLISPVRSFPKSSYIKEEIIESTYYNSLNLFVEMANQMNIFSLTQFKYTIKRFEYWLKDFEIGSMLKIIETDDVIKPMIELFSNKMVPLNQISSGSLQLLPILFFLCTNLKRSKHFFIQQPELHLHPRLQSKIVDLLIDALNPTIIDFWDEAYNELAEKYNETDILDRVALQRDYLPAPDLIKEDSSFANYTVPTHLIIETHSEHLLKKLQVLVSQGKTLQLWPDGRYSGVDVKLKDAFSIYYFAKDKNGNTKAIEMELDDNGFFKTETPKGFFDESLELNRQLLLGRN
jgi:predicted ATPase